MDNYIVKYGGFVIATFLAASEQGVDIMYKAIVTATQMTAAMDNKTEPDTNLFSVQIEEMCDGKGIYSNNEI